MSTPNEVYTNKISQFNQKIAKLEEANRADIKRIPELEKEYQEAINAIEIQKADGVHAEIDRLQRSTEIRKTQIAALKDKAHPERQSAKAEYLAGLKLEGKEIIQQYTPVHQEIMAAREAYLKLASAAVPFINDFYNNAREQHRIEDPGFPMLHPVGLPGGLGNYIVHEAEILKVV